MSASAPVLEGAASDAVAYRGGHLQIIASAGSGKTEVVSQRVVDLLVDGVAPEAVVAFTFTERAAAELKDRIALRLEQRAGRAALDRLSGLFVGTIHAFCFRFLQQEVPRYETYDVLDDNQLTAFLAREATRLDVRQLDPRGRMFASIAEFLRSVDVVENELLDPQTMPDAFGTILRTYYATLDRYRLLTFGQQVVRAVDELSRPALRDEVHGRLRHLIVDEYQDVNPAQERLIHLLTGPDTALCVVGDDQQAIYQWRGSDVGNIAMFRHRYPDVATFDLLTNRRSRPEIIGVANEFAGTIPGRLAGPMGTHRPPADGTEAAVAVWSGGTEMEEAGWIASMVLDLVERGLRYRDIAVLVRSRAAYPKLLDQFAAFDIPVQPAGRTGLFEQPEAVLLGETIAWLADFEWRGAFGPGVTVTERHLLDRYLALFPGTDRRVLRDHLRRWKTEVPRTSRTADLVGELYLLLDILDVRAWDLRDPLAVNRLGTLARFSSLLADYESVRRRARPDADAPGEQVGGQDRGVWYYGNLAAHVINYAQGAYEGFDGEAGYDLDAVDLTTIHRAKGLEWPAVFVPSVTGMRFPSRQTGRPQSWFVPRDRFAAARYEGSDADERRLFYVAVTRARDWLSVSRHERVNTRSVSTSPYFRELSHLESDPASVLVPALEPAVSGDDAPLSLTYSELAAYLDCGHAFRLRELIGFQPRLAVELGYGKAVHHVLRAVAEATRESGRTPGPAEVESIMDGAFFLPTANKAAHRQLRAAATRLVATYIRDHEDDLHRVWETERPFELHLDGVVVSGRADVILDHEDGIPTALAIVDYKTSVQGDVSTQALQLQVYADAGRREGLDVRATYLHDLRAAERIRIGAGPEALAEAEGIVVAAARGLRDRDHRPNPGTRCAACEVRTVCASSTRRR